MINLFDELNQLVQFIKLNRKDMKFLYVLIFMTFAANSQNNSVKINYEAMIKDQVYNDVRNSNSVNEFLQKTLVESQDIIKNIQFELIGDNSIYYLFYREPMISDSQIFYSITGAISGVFDGNCIYADLSTKKSILGGFDVGVKIDRELSMEDLEWKLFNESKIILGKICYKAIGNLKSKDSAHAAHYPITAWYCPEINFQCGPTPFATLPGAIMQLENDKSLITAVSYKLGNFKVKKYKSSNRLMKYSDFVKFMKEWSEENMKKN